MSVLSHPVATALAARVARLGARAGMRPPLDRFPEFPRRTDEISVPTSLGPARAVLYRPAGTSSPPLHVNLHGGGFVLGLTELDDPLCRAVAELADVAVLNVDYALAPRHPFPGPARQAHEVLRWAASHGERHGWDGTRLSVGGQSAGGSLAAAAARQVLERGGPALALQALLYPVLDLSTPLRAKRSPQGRPMSWPRLGELLSDSYVPDPRQRTDRLISPAAPGATADLTGIAPALLITAGADVLHDEGERYAGALREVGALAEHHDVADAGHGFDVRDPVLARETYELIARHVRRALHPQG
ncbi:alpha/beta hydrolase fold domain-containing protein [Saccharopolyspora sp. MS10]|uniref:alpha/beta hydrolase fold domain-containing protein n=1 Tax=Saccharopolyspora sp. MS10 TaxID=3385973 RepID=UPI0039A11092